MITKSIIYGIIDLRISSNGKPTIKVRNNLRLAHGVK